ncbi:Metal-dependent membrane protease, CAAX family [Halalkaliarchaeum sp. AArc-CO]|uniref:CPBP family intramembrane glutamic endopeptidase n=1 Tax=unclassified Halalkaliarchaeum TaxID=2678344 RepID=UPI00217CF361|nr:MULTISPECIES: CPBP family intramembrane glutamic endopeptidase [unclassified Halalkaliarchaeum]MDR5672378.1 CPBP family intramembrane metalloprotease [Halalkaliarchaeum sp. AArc-GB]UWG49992.1 Metal-dependent membrane protease, CAAX family [Halalkaliarchaeum sp. AArc-CO]
MPDWTTFTAFAAVTTVLVLLLARASQSMLARTDQPESQTDADDSGQPGNDGRAAAPGDVPASTESATTSAESTMTTAEPELTTTALLANVAVSQGAFLLLIGLGAWLFGVPAWAFGVDEATVGVDLVGLGLVAGVLLYLGNEAAAAIGKRHGFTGSEELRRRLAPDTVVGWFALLFVVLPLIAVFEEVLFRGALIGVAAAGFDVSPWLLAVVSSVAFGFGHGAQGKLGIVVTGVLGFLLAALFIASGSLLLVIVAHYVVNVLEFLVHEALGWEPFDGDPRPDARPNAS